MGSCTSATSKASATTGTAPRASATTPAPTCKDDTHGSLTCAADSPDLHHWRPAGLAVGHRTYGGPNVFELGGHYWMFVDEWRGQGVLSSDDLVSWELRGLILDKPGRRPEDGAIGLHADVVVQGGTAYVFCFTHPGRVGPVTDDDGTCATRRSSLQVAAARVVDGILRCDRDEPVRLDLLGAGAVGDTLDVVLEPAPGSVAAAGPTIMRKSHVRGGRGR